jgi:superfamily II DNA helicase RecQ
MIEEEDEETKKRKFKFAGSTIVYCPTKSTTGEVYEALKSIGIKCDMYHAGLSLERRKASQTNFINDVIDVCKASKPIK